MKKLIFVFLLMLSFTLKSSFISHDKIDNNEEVQKMEMTSDGCWKVHFDCDGDKFTKYVKGLLWEMPNREQRGCTLIVR